MRQRTMTAQLLRPPRPGPPPLAATVTPPAQAAPLLHRRRTRRREKEKEKEKAGSVRTSRRANGEAAPEPDIEDAKSRRKASKADTKGSSAGGKGALNALADVATAASGAGAASTGAQDDRDDDSTRFFDRPDLVKKADHKNRENQKHASGDWGGQVAHRRRAWQEVLQGELRPLGRQALGDSRVQRGHGEA